MPRGTCRVRGLPVAPPDRGQIRLVPKTRRGFGPGRVAFSPQSKPSPNGEPDSGVWLVRTSAPPRGRRRRLGAQRAHARDSLPTSAPSLVGNGQFGPKTGRFNLGGPLGGISRQLDTRDLLLTSPLARGIPRGAGH